MKLLTRVLFFVTVVLATGGLVGGDVSGQGRKENISLVQNSVDPERQIIVYYFHGKSRCVACKKIESYTDAAVKSGFARELKNKSIEFKVVDVEAKDNEHFVRDYQLFTKSVVVVDVLKGRQIRWKNLTRVWEFVANQDAFQAYIVNEIKAFRQAG